MHPVADLPKPWISRDHPATLAVRFAFSHCACAAYSLKVTLPPFPLPKKVVNKSQLKGKEGRKAWPAMSRTGACLPFWACWALPVFLWSHPAWTTRGNASLLLGSGSGNNCHFSPLFSKEGVSGSSLSRTVPSSSCPCSHLGHSHGCLWASMPRAGFTGVLPGVSPGMLLGMLKSSRATLGRVSTHLEFQFWRSGSVFHGQNTASHVLHTHFYFWTASAGQWNVRFKMSLKAVMVY